MQHLKKTLATHPNPKGQDAERRANLIRILSECALSCHACADACLAEPKVDMLRECIATDLLCGELCQSLARALTRQTAHDAELQAALLAACRSACRACGQECEKHASHHAHCAHCAQMCRECEKACNEYA